MIKGEAQPQKERVLKAGARWVLDVAVFFEGIVHFATLSAKFTVPTCVYVCASQAVRLQLLRPGGVKNKRPYLAGRTADLYMLLLMFLLSKILLLQSICVSRHHEVSDSTPSLMLPLNCVASQGPCCLLCAICDTTSPHLLFKIW